MIERLIVTAALAGLMLLAPFSLVAEDVIKETAAGGVNWSQGVVFAHGYGTAKADLSTAQKRILSRRAAIVDGQRNLLEMTKGVRITSALVTDQAMKENLEIATRVEGIIKGAQPIKENFQNDVYMVTMAMPISGEFLKVIYPEKTRATTFQLRTLNILDDGLRQLALTGDRVLDFFVPAATASESLVIRTREEADAYRKLLEWLKQGNAANVEGALGQAIMSYESNNQYSGLLIDASGVTNFELATVPNIRDEEGNVIYPNPQTSYDDIVNKRGVTYDFDIQDAVRNQRVATLPFTVVAVSTYKNLPSDLVIRKQDADRVKGSASTIEAMNKAGVLIVVAI